MRITMLCVPFAPRRCARNGGELRFWQNASSLLALGHKLTLLVPADRVQDLDLQADGTALEIIPTKIQRPAEGRWNSYRLALLSMLSNRAALRYFLRIDPESLTTALRQVEREPNQLVWAEWVGGMWAAVPFKRVLYSHTDFLHKVINVRYQTKRRRITLRERLRLRRLQRAELALSDRAQAVICVSAAEAVELTARRTDVTYIPIVGPTIRRPEANAEPVARVFLFGTGANTAMRRALAFLREELWPRLGEVRNRVEWHSVGEPDGLDVGGNWTWMVQHFKSHGFVEDLSRVFRPGDGLLMPYPENTGFRTRFVTAAAYGVVAVGLQSTFSCAPEFKNELNCLVAQDTAGLVRQLERFSSDRTLRSRLGRAAMELYRREFSFEAQLPKYRLVLERLTESDRRK